MKIAKRKASRRLRELYVLQQRNPEKYLATRLWYLSHWSQELVHAIAKRDHECIRQVYHRARMYGWFEEFHAYLPIWLQRHGGQAVREHLENYGESASRIVTWGQQLSLPVDLSVEYATAIEDIGGPRHYRCALRLSRLKANAQ